MDDITKIKFTEKKTKICQKSEASDRERETTTVFEIERHPDFDKAMQALVPHVLNVLQLPETYAENMEVSGISLSCNDTQGEGAVVTCTKTLGGIGAPLVLNTPHLHEDPEMTGSSKMPDDMRIAINAIEKEAKNFLNGKSAQLEMFSKSEKAA